MTVTRISGLCRATCKTRERRSPRGASPAFAGPCLASRFTFSASPLRPVFVLEFLSMEPPCSSSQPKNRLKVGLPLIHPEFCKRLCIAGNSFRANAFNGIRQGMGCSRREAWQPAPPCPPCTLEYHTGTPRVLPGAGACACRTAWWKRRYLCRSAPRPRSRP